MKYYRENSKKNTGKKIKVITTSHRDPDKYSRSSILARAPKNTRKIKFNPTSVVENLETKHIHFQVQHLNHFDMIEATRNRKMGEEKEE